jgi:hypothetical protein
MIEESKVVFQGSGPHHLPLVQRATAHGGSNEVAMTLYAVVEDQGPNPIPIGIQMVAIVARELGMALMVAADEADRAKGRS